MGKLMSIIAVIPVKHVSPTSSHNKYDTKVMKNGIIQKACKNPNGKSNLVTSFDKRFTTCPVATLPSVA